MRAIALLLTALALGCSDGTGPLLASCQSTLTGGGDLCGTWAADGMVPGASLILDIRIHQNQLGGTGTYSIEAGRSGDLTVQGTYNAPAVAFDLHYDYGYSASYAGTVSGSHITGTLTGSNGQGYPLDFSPTFSR